MFKGTLLSQFLGIIGSLALAKIYGAEAFGYFGVFIGIISLTAVFATLQLEYCIVNSKNKNDSKSLMNSLFLIVPFLIINCLCIYLIISSFFPFEKLPRNLVIVSILISLIVAFNKILESFFTYQKKFKPIAFSKVLSTVFNILFQIILYYQFKLMGLIYGNIISIFLVFIYLAYKNRQNFSLNNFINIKQHITNNHSVIKYLFPSSFVNILAVTFIPIFIAFIFSFKEFGVYFLSLKILGVPLFLISSSIMPVYFEKASKLFFHSKEKLYDLTVKIVKTNFIIICICLLIINSFGIYILELLFNTNWDNLRLYTLTLSFLIVAKAVYNPISDIMVVLNKNHVGLVLNIYLLTVTVLAIYIGYLYQNILYTIAVISFVGGIGYFTALFFFLKTLKRLK